MEFALREKYDGALAAETALAASDLAVLLDDVGKHIEAETTASQRRDVHRAVPRL